MQKITDKSRQKFDAIIILGCSINPDNTITPVLKNRLDKGIDIFRKKLANKIIVSGLYGIFRFKKGMITQAEAMKNYLLNKGIPKSSIIKEENSLDTIGEAYFIKINILEQNRWFNPVIVTSDFHIKRTRYIFNKVLGSKYNASFIGSKFNFTKEDYKRWIRSEERLLRITKWFLDKIQDGNDCSFKKFLFNIHPFYLISKNWIRKILCRFIVPRHYRRCRFL